MDFNPSQKIDEVSNKVGNYCPVTRNKLKEENNLLYRHLVYLARIELVQICMHCPDDIHANEEGRYSYQ